MPEIIETPVYRLEELQDAAKEAARDWYREGCLDDDWHEAVHEDFGRVCEILGVALKTRSVPLYGGGSRQAPRIYFSGFWSQGDGASFDAFYSFARAAPAQIRRYAPQDPELHRIADALAAVQRRNFYQLQADICRRGRYCHEHSMAIAVERDSGSGQPMTGDAEDRVCEALRDLARWLYRQLEREYEFRISAEVVDEAIVANDYTFTQSGIRFG